MGREANCKCIYRGEAIEIKALLESHELILRGRLSHRVSFAEMTQVKATAGWLGFRFQDETWSLELGSDLAAKWAAIVAAPPSSLAKKMGISAEVSVELAGELDDKALEEALLGAKTVTKRGGDLIVARVDTPDALARVLKSKAEPLAQGIPMWVVYPKGRGHALAESDVRELCLAAGLVDHKVAAVSGALTALRFVRRRSGVTARS